MRYYALVYAICVHGAEFGDFRPVSGDEPLDEVVSDLVDTNLITESASGVFVPSAQLVSLVRSTDLLHLVSLKFEEPSDKDGRLIYRAAVDSDDPAIKAGLLRHLDPAAPVHAPTPDVDVVDAPTPDVDVVDAPTPDVDVVDAPTSDVDVVDAPTPDVDVVDAPTPEVCVERLLTRRGVVLAVVESDRETVKVSAGDYGFALVGDEVRVFRVTKCPVCDAIYGVDFRSTSSGGLELSSVFEGLGYKRLDSVTEAPEICSSCGQSLSRKRIGSDTLNTTIKSALMHLGGSGSAREVSGLCQYNVRTIARSMRAMAADGVLCVIEHGRSPVFGFRNG